MKLEIWSLRFDVNACYLYPPISNFEFQITIADVIVDTEKQYLHKHLISQNIAVFKSLITKPHPAVSIFTFHYACPPDAVAVNYRLNKPIGDNENGLRGIDDAPYRHEAWAFIFAGGALFSHLDYSFTVGHEDGSFTLPTKQCGGGTPALREQFRHLKEFIEGFCFIAMKPDNTVIRSCVALVSLCEVSKYIGGLWFDSVNNATRAAVVFAYPLVETGKQYAIYVHGGTRAELSLFLPKGRYVASWFHPCNGRTEPADIFNHEEGERLFITPAYEEDIALSIRRSGSITHTGDRS